MKERVKESYLKMLKAKLEEEIKSYEIAKKDTIEAEGRMVTRYDSTKTETGWLVSARSQSRHAGGADCLCGQVQRPGL